METNISIEPIPANPGYVAHITGHLADPESDPSGLGMTRMAAALDLARVTIEGAHDCACLAIAAVLRADMAAVLPTLSGEQIAVYERAIATVEGIA